MVDIWKWRLLDFHEAAGNHFQPTCWTWKKSKEAAIFRFPRSFPRTWRRERQVNITTKRSSFTDALAEVDRLLGKPAGHIRRNDEAGQGLFGTQAWKGN
jgi:hypothetical protein